MARAATVDIPAAYGACGLPNGKRRAGERPTDGGVRCAGIPRVGHLLEAGSGVREAPGVEVVRGASARHPAFGSRDAGGRCCLVRPDPQRKSTGKPCTFFGDTPVTSGGHGGCAAAWRQPGFREGPVMGTVGAEPCGAAALAAGPGIRAQSSDRRASGALCVHASPVGAGRPGQGGALWTRRVVRRGERPVVGRRRFRRRDSAGMRSGHGDRA